MEEVVKVEAREATTPKENGSKTKRFIRAIIGLVVVVFTLYLFKEVLLPVEPNSGVEKNKEIVMYILGVLSAIVGQIIGFYFGSSEDNKSS